jgi:hypothetical protein
MGISTGATGGKYQLWFISLIDVSFVRMFGSVLWLSLSSQPLSQFLGSRQQPIHRRHGERQFDAVCDQAQRQSRSTQKSNRVHQALQLHRVIRLSSLLEKVIGKGHASRDECAA